MNPFFIRNRIHRYLDCELSEQEQLEMEKALEEHPDILEEIEDLQSQHLFLSENGQKRAPQDLLSNILDEIEKEPIPAPSKTGANNFRWYILCSVALALFAILLPKKPQQTSENNNEIKSARSIPIPNIIELPPRDELSSEISKTKSVQEKKEQKNTARSVKQKKSEPANQTLNFVIGTPENPYVATWEETTTHQIDLSISKEQEEFYQLRLAKEDILFRLEAIAQNAGGKLVSSEGNSFTPFNLTSEKGFQTVKIIVPQENYSTIDENLRQLGAKTSLQTLPIVNGQVFFPIAIYYQFY